MIKATPRNPRGAHSSVETAHLSNGAVTTEKISGVIPVSKGGTGATTGLAALNNLGLTILDAPGDYSADDGYAISPLGVMALLNEIYSTTATGVGSCEFTSSTTTALQVSGTANGITLDSSGLTIVDEGNYEINVKFTVEVGSAGFGRSLTLTGMCDISSVGSIQVATVSGSDKSATGEDVRTVHLTAGSTIGFSATMVKNGSSGSQDTYAEGTASVVFTVTRKVAA